jgi:hypothetical protein
MTTPLNDATARLAKSMEKVGDSMEQVFVDINSVFVEADKVFDEVGKSFETTTVEKTVAGKTTKVEVDCFGNVKVNGKTYVVEPDPLPKSDWVLAFMRLFK